MRWAFFRHLFAIAVLPFTVTVLVPRWLLREGVRPGLASDPLGMASQLAGALSLAVGLWLFVQSVRHFAGRGRGTLAPWDPPRQLVVTGPYRYVRNPMISGVLFILIGEALWLRSWAIAGWAALFAVINVIYISTFEEPQLERRFGEAYRDYCRRVRRVLPRWRPPHERGTHHGGWS